MCRIQAAYFRKSTEFCKLQAKICFGSHRVYHKSEFFETFKSINLDSVAVRSKLTDQEEKNSPPPSL